MSILDSLIKTVKKELKGVEQQLTNALGSEKPAAPVQEEQPQSSVIPGGVPNGYVIGGGNCAPQGDHHERSRYESVPAEECQYNFGGTYLDYFSKVFREEFPEYAVSLEQIDSARRYKYTFRKGENVALVVELMTENSSAQALRRECQRAGIPYLRFYFDHEGWWNTRAYVKNRVAEALGI